MSNAPEIFNGTSISAGHVGDAANNALNTRTVQLTPNGDTGDAQTVDIQVLDADGKPLRAVTRIEIRLFQATMIEALAAAWTMAETGAGTVVSTTANAALVLDTDANGQAQVTITDVATGTTATLYAKAKALNVSSAETLTAIAFAT